MAFIAMLFSWREERFHLCPEFIRDSPPIICFNQAHTTSSGMAYSVIASLSTTEIVS
jgi:hypothetical protein